MKSTYLIVRKPTWREFRKHLNATDMSPCISVSIQKYRKSKHKVNVPESWWELTRILMFIETRQAQGHSFGRATRGIVKFTQDLKELRATLTPELNTEITEEWLPIIEKSWTFTIAQFRTNFNFWTTPITLKRVTHNRSSCRYKKNPVCAQVEISPDRKFWYVYKRKRLGYYTGKGIPFSTPETYREFALVHEFTHALEWIINTRRNRKYTRGETNTTLHELRYAKAHYPELFGKLHKIKDGRKDSWFSPV